MCITFRPSIESIESTRRYAAELFQSLRCDDDTTSRAALTIHELLENIVKYSADGYVTLDVGIAAAEEAGGVVSAQDSVIRIRASNRARPEQLSELRRRLDALQELDDPMAVYVRMLIHAAPTEHGSGLGLARIRVEGEMALTYSVEGDRITITAVTPLQAGSGSDAAAQLGAEA